MRRYELVAAVMVAVALTAGCNDTTSGTPSTDSPTKIDAAVWNPCDGGIPDSALTANGYDPATQRKDVAGVEFAGWKVCEWKATEFRLSVYSGDKPFDDLAKNPNLRDLGPVTVANREQASRNQRAGRPDDAVCDVSIATRYGFATFSASPNNFAVHGLDVCGEALRTANAFEQYVPR